MATKVPIVAVPNELRYDHEEVLEGGAQFFRFETLNDLKLYWAHGRAEMRYACVGTGYTQPARFLEHHEWVFAPSKAALIAAVVRWDEFRITPRWYDAMSDEWPVSQQLQRRREARRDLRMALGTWSQHDETAYTANSGLSGRGLRKGFWRLASLPCGLTHFDWFSEHARMPDDPEVPRERVAKLLQQMTYDDWKEHHPLGDVHLMDAPDVDEEIGYWERERAEDREPYED